MSCPRQYETEGYRTYSDYVPGFAQGAYFPEDRPEICCDISRDVCENLDHRKPWNCDYAHDAEPHIHCAGCLESKGAYVKLQVDGYGHHFCPECHDIYSDADFRIMARVLSAHIDLLRKILESRK